MKILTICEGGTVRSVALARVAKQRGHDAVALSRMWNSKETFAMLSQWADKILYIIPDMIDWIPDSEQHKSILVAGMETDPWCNPLHDELVKLANSVLDRILESK